MNIDGDACLALGASGRDSRRQAEGRGNADGVEGAPCVHFGVRQAKRVRRGDEGQAADANDAFSVEIDSPGVDESLDPALDVAAGESAQ